MNLEQIRMVGVEEKSKWGRVAFILFNLIRFREEKKILLDEINKTDDEDTKKYYNELIYKKNILYIKTLKTKLFCADVLYAKEKALEEMKECKDTKDFQDLIDCISPILEVDFEGGPEDDWVISLYEQYCFPEILKDLGVDYRVSFAKTNLAYELAEKYLNNIELTEEEKNTKIETFKKLVESKVVYLEHAIEYILDCVKINEGDLYYTEENEFEKKLEQSDRIQAKYENISYEEYKEKREQKEQLKTKLLYEEIAFEKQIQSSVDDAIIITKYFLAKKYNLMQEYKSFLMENLVEFKFDFFGKKFDFNEDGSRNYTDEEIAKLQEEVYLTLAQNETFFTEQSQESGSMSYLLHNYAGQLGGYDIHTLTKSLYKSYRKAGLLADKLERGVLPYKIVLLYAVDEFLKTNETVEIEQVLNISFSDELVNVVKKDIKE